MGVSGQADRPTLAALAARLRAGQLDPSILASDPRAGARQIAVRWERQRRRLEDEHRRLDALFARERAAWADGVTAVAGVDEAGRGPLAGPVVAGAVMFPEIRHIRGLKDSKQLQPDEREALYDDIAASGAALGVGMADVDEINRFNILGATRMAWSRAIHALSAPPALIFLDGNLTAMFSVPVVTVVRGDAVCASIAAASIVAKVVRDRLMVDLDRRYPEYGFARHKGYATAEHLALVRHLGPSPAHRRAFLPADLAQQRLPLGS